MSSCRQTDLQTHKKARSLFRTFLSYYRGERRLFFADLLAASLVAIIDLAFPQILRSLSGGLFSQGYDPIMSILFYLAIGLVLMYIVRFACRYFVIYWGHVMGARMENHMREDLFDAYNRMSLSYFDKNKTGDLMSRLISDLFDISETAHHGPEYLIIGFIEIVGSFVILGFINVPLTVALALIACLLVAFNVYANLRMRKVYTENRIRISGVNSQVEDSLAGVKVVRSFAAEDTERRKFRRSNNAYFDSKVKMYRAMGNYQAAISIMMGGLNTVVLVYGGWLIAHGQMQPVDLATYALYISLFTTPMTSILDFTETFQKAIAGFKRFCEVLDARPDVRDKPNAPELKIREGRIEYQHVDFAYAQDGQEHPAHVIKDLSFVLEPGKTIALVGPSGGGKSTTCSLLMRFYDVNAGSITIDGTDIRDVTQKSLREAIGLVQQEVYLFDGTIAENIAYGNPHATQEDIAEAARKANIADYIESLPNAYETPVGERGGHLSGGQRQRIAIARTFLKNPPILILDEATSALDNESEQAVQASLAELSKGRTTLVIAHRLSTIKNADEIITMENGRISERGTHDELLKQNGTYARYVNMQFASIQ